MTRHSFRSQHQQFWLTVAVRGLIHTYRGVVSPLLMPACRFHPSCSHYALDALKRHGVLQGGWLAIQRLLRCQPWGGQGYDPVPLNKNDTRIKRK